MDFSLGLILILFALGILFGFLAAMGGIGGGPFYVPFLTVFLNIAIQEAIDTSILIILVTSSAALYTYLKQRRCNLKIALVFSIFSILGSIISSLIFTFYPLNSEFIKVIFSALLIIIAINMLYKTRFSSKLYPSEDSETCDLHDFHTFKEDLKKGIPFFILAGFSANLLGIGGGVINMPALNIVVGYPIHFSTAISTGMVFITALFNTIVKIFYGQINYTLAIIIGPGGIFGSVLGAHVSNKIPTRALQLAVAVILIGSESILYIIGSKKKKISSFSIMVIFLTAVI